jgi:hypothetical protein
MLRIEVLHIAFVANGYAVLPCPPWPFVDLAQGRGQRPAVRERLPVVSMAF